MKDSKADTVSTETYPVKLKKASLESWLSRCQNEDTLVLYRLEGDHIGLHNTRDNTIYILQIHAPGES